MKKFGGFTKHDNKYLFCVNRKWVWKRAEFWKRYTIFVSQCIERWESCVWEWQKI